MLFNIFQLFCLIMFFIAVEMLIKNRIIKTTARVFGILFFFIELISVFMADSLVDYKFYMHLNPAIILDKVGFFVKEGVLMLLFGIILFFILKLGRQRLALRINPSKYISIGILVTSFIGLNLNHGIVQNLWDIKMLQSAKTKSFDDAISQFDFQHFIKKQDLESVKGKNIIVIMLESVEEAYLKDNLAHLTPELRKLANKYSYYNMKPSVGSDYTTAGVYTYFTGFPMFFKNHGNDIFGRALDSQIPSIANVLDKSNYNQLYLMGNPEFAGMKTMLGLFNVKVKSEKNYDKKYTIPHWGLHDKDLFELAKKEVIELAKDSKPFALYISSVSTHAPDGILDKRMTKELPAQRSKLELMVAAIDKHVGEFVKYLEEEHILDNTAIFIMPDHLLMGRMSRVINDFELPRELYLITNSSQQSYDTSHSILQIDVPKIIMEGANIATNMSFFTDIIEGDKLEYIQQHKKQLLQFNEASLESEISAEKIVVQDKIKPQSNIVQLKSIAWNGDNTLKKSTILLGTKSVEAKRGVNLIRWNVNHYQVENYDTYNDTIVSGQLVDKLRSLTASSEYFALLVHDSAGDALSYYKESLKELGFNVLSTIKNRQAYVAFSYHNFVSEALRPNSFYANIPYLPKQLKRERLVIDKESQEVDRFIAHAGGVINDETYTNCLEAMNASYKKGYRLFELDVIKTKDGHFVASHDWDTWQKNCSYSGALPPTLEEFRKHKIRWKYTPVAMTDINEWFAQHTDAILVTDKVNDPERFVPLFVDKSRLMMELFSMDAAKRAQQLGIRDVILSERCLDYLIGDKVNALLNEGINYLAISRRTTDSQRELYLKIKKAGIKVFAYHVNHDPLKDEAYMLREGMDYCYGFYADFHSFK